MNFRRNGSRRRPKTKIVCTLGPATESQDTIRALIEAGMSVARLNMSHGTSDTHVAAIERVRAASRELKIPVSIMVDVPGTKYRTGPLSPAVINVKPGDRVTLTSRNIVGDHDVIGVYPPGIHRDASTERPVLIDDGLLEFRVLNVRNEDVECEVVVGGRITERRGVITPGKSPSQEFPDKRARECLRFAAIHQADYVALSTVISAEDILKSRAILEQNGARPLIVSKIERVEALDNFREILDASDSIMVARGDMGVEVPLARIPRIQKDLITKSNAAGKPVITATQMLESMVKSPVPTRAEVTDVANAIYDGTDAIMLSGESSVGDYPVQAVRVMAEVALEAESGLNYEKIILERLPYVEKQVDDAISYSAVRSAYQLNASLIVAFTQSGGTVGRVSKFRPHCPILALTHDEQTQRRLTLRWGATPVVVGELKTVEDFFAVGEEQARKSGAVGPGDLVVLVAGVPIGVPGGTNLLRVMKISG